MTQLNEDSKTERGDMYSYYEDYCKRENRTPLGKNTFFKSMIAKKHNPKKYCGEWYYFGLEIPFTSTPKLNFN